MKPLLLSSKQFYDLKLSPTLRLGRYKAMKIAYRVIRDFKGNPIGDEYLLAKSSKKQATRYGFEPYYLRLACADDPVKVLDFLLPVTKGQLHPSIFAYMLSPAHQQDVARGTLPGFKPLRHTGTQQDPDHPSDKMDKDFNIAVALDNDYRRVARKKNFDLTLERKILGERGDYLLEKDNA